MVLYSLAVPGQERQLLVVPPEHVAQEVSHSAYPLRLHKFVSVSGYCPFGQDTRHVLVAVRVYPLGHVTHWLLFGPLHVRQLVKHAVHTVGLDW